MNENPKEKLSQISRDEVDVINDIRELNFGRINIIIQDGVIVSKEITRVVRNNKNRNNRTRNNGENIGGSDEGEIY
jgi:hypothetical protein